MIHELVHRRVVENVDRLNSWFAQLCAGKNFPVYCSFDIRDASFKVAEVDANIYPAGFNNICSIDQDRASTLMKRYLDYHYGTETVRVALLTEVHSANSHYWENVRVLSKIISESGREVRVCIPKDLDSPVSVVASSGQSVLVHSAKRVGNSVVIDSNFHPQVILSNNDFSEPHESWADGLETPVNPPRELGWYRRKKSTHFKYYNSIVGEFANILGIDPWYFQIQTELFSNFDIDDPSSRSLLAERVDAMIHHLRSEYSRRGIDRKPVLFVKNNAGTYGLAVTSVSSADEILQWNSKTRKKMSAAKGGKNVVEVIIQEGIPTVVTSGNETAEPVVYMIGCELAGAFLRTHTEKGPTESLNSPGAIFKSMCMSELQVNIDGHPLENVYGWIARLSLFAISQEAEEMAVPFPKYQPGCIRGPTNSHINP